MAERPSPGPRIATGIDEVDRVLGGGLVRGATILLAGEPGVGKSTLVLQLVAGLAEKDLNALLITGEESVDQVALRAARVPAATEAVRIAASASLDEIVALAAREKPHVLVVDSIQAIRDERLEHATGSPVQVRECSATLVRLAKTTDTIVIVVGHVTKEGTVAGPKTLEHVVDVVLGLEGERSGSLRLLRAAKNRFGACDETGVFTMTGAGLETVGDPSAMLLADRREGVPGSAVFPCIEGSRPVLVEIQALASPSALAQPRRVAIGLDARRLALVIGVLHTHGDVTLTTKDVFVAAAGGLTVREPACDLALCLALWSAANNIPIDGRTVAFGEVGLAGEVRRVPGIERRLSEAERLGFRTALVPHRTRAAAGALELVPVADVGSAFRAARDVVVHA